jgi:hypothetical protein
LEEGEIRQRGDAGLGGNQAEDIKEYFDFDIVLESVDDRVAMQSGKLYGKSGRRA